MTVRILKSKNENREIEVFNFFNWEGERLFLIRERVSKTKTVEGTLSSLGLRRFIYGFNNVK